MGSESALTEAASFPTAVSHSGLGSAYTTPTAAKVWRCEFVHPMAVDHPFEAPKGRVARYAQPAPDRQVPLHVGDLEQLHRRWIDLVAP
jgi:hypothetical protein